MVVTAVAVDLATNLAAWPARAVNVDVSGAGANGRDQLIKFTGRDTALVGEVSNIPRCDGPVNRRWRRWTGLRICGTVAEVRAKEDADRAGDGPLTKVNMSLLDRAFEIGVTQLPLDF